MRQGRLGLHPQIRQVVRLLVGERRTHRKRATAAVVLFTSALMLSVESSHALDQGSISLEAVAPLLIAQTEPEKEQLPSGEIQERALPRMPVGGSTIPPTTGPTIPPNTVLRPKMNKYCCSCRCQAWDSKGQVHTPYLFARSIQRTNIPVLSCIVASRASSQVNHDQAQRNHLSSRAGRNLSKERVG